MAGVSLVVVTHAHDVGVGVEEQGGVVLGAEAMQEMGVQAAAQGVGLVGHVDEVHQHLHAQCKSAVGEVQAKSALAQSGGKGW